MARQFRLALVVISLVISIFSVNPASSSAQGSKPGVSTVKPPLKPLPTGDQVTNIPYFSLRDGMSSTLVLNNNMTTETKVQVTIFNPQGKGQALAPITLAPRAIMELSLGDLVVSPEFNSGNIEVQYNGPMMGVTCQVGIFSTEKRVSFESREQDMMDFKSSNLNGIVWVPSSDAKGYLAVTNAGMTKVTVQMKIGPSKRQLSLFPHETELVNLDAAPGGHQDTAQLIALSHDGKPGDIVTTGFVLDLKNGYSSGFTMFDPSMSGSSKLAGAHFRFGKPSDAEGFPEGTDFRSPLFLANVNGNPVSATVSVDYTTVEETKTTPVKSVEKVNTLSLKSLTLASGEVQRIQLDQELAKLGVDGPVEDAGVEIDYQGAPGSLIGELTSVDQTGDYSFEVPVKDPAGKSEMAGGSYPWTLDGGADTILHLKNTTDKTQYAFVHLGFPGGAGYSPAPMQLKPHQTALINIQKLKDSKKPDVMGQVFPDSATHGQLIWMEKGTPHALIGRAEQVDAKIGIARSFSCGYWCPCTINFADTWMYPGGTPYDAFSGGGVGSYTGAVGYSGTPFYPREDYEDCGGYYFPGYTYAAPDASYYSVAGEYGWGSTWSSDNSTVASVDSSSGAVTFNSAGSTTIRFDWDEYYYTWDDFYQWCDDTDYPLEITAQVTVLVPTSLSIVSGTDSTTSEATCATSGGTGCGVSRSFTYQVSDQNGNPLQVAGYQFWDAFSNISPDPLGLAGSILTTCSPDHTNSGPCGMTTDSNGQFIEHNLGDCSTGCYSGSACTTDGGAYTQATQTYHVGPSTISQTIKYYCDHVTVNGS